MRFVNRTGGGIRVVCRFLGEELSDGDRHRTIRILDLGSGDCYVPLAVSRWARQKGYDVEFTCLDHNAVAMSMAREGIQRSGDGSVKLEKADIFTFRPVVPFDYAVGSMFFHHLTTEEIGRLIEHLRGFVRKAVLINDLRRDLLHYIVWYVLALPIDPEIRHDALLSIRRGFKPAELATLLGKYDPAARVGTRWFRRVAGVVHFHRTEGE